jgi:hypothetical protein
MPIGWALGQPAIAWGDVPTWIGAVATVLAFGAAAFAGWSAWKVLTLERERDADRRRADEAVQAVKIAAWPSVVRSDPVDPDSGPVWGAALRNASDLPVYQVHVEFVPIRSSGGQHSVVLELVPPGEWLLSGVELYPRPGQPLLRADARDLPDRPYVIELRFVDAADRAWRRTWQGLLARGS